MEEALIGLGGVLIGVLLNEFFRRKNSIEIYSQQIFDKRLKIYEGLMILLQEGGSIASEVMQNTGLSKEDRYTIISESIGSIAKYADDNALYLDHYIIAQFTALLMGMEDIQDIQDKLQRETEINRFWSDYRTTIEIIIADSGVAEVNKHFKAISKSKPSTTLIRYMKQIEKQKGYR